MERKPPAKRLIVKHKRPILINLPLHLLPSPYPSVFPKTKSDPYRRRMPISTE
jgi:hypothetical protein